MIEATPSTAVIDEHHAADLEDVVGVALGDAVVDDVAVERRQVQVADRLDEQQRRGRCAIRPRYGAR